MSDDDRGLPPEILKPDFLGWVHAEGESDPRKGFQVRAYWRFSNRGLTPTIHFRMRAMGTMYRVTLRPEAKSSWPRRDILMRYLATQEAARAQDYGAPQGIQEEEAHAATPSRGRDGEPDTTEGIEPSDRRPEGDEQDAGGGPESPVRDDPGTD
jgi:hypothetical protein